MFVVALMVVGLVSLKFIPVSLMPDIDIPQITVQVRTRVLLSGNGKQGVEAFAQSADAGERAKEYPK
jgi:hypothetical protein